MELLVCFYQPTVLSITGWMDFYPLQSLQVMSAIVEAQALPVSRYVDVTCLVKARLFDKLSNVRKYSMQLVSSLIAHNPYGAKVSMRSNPKSYLLQLELSSQSTSIAAES